MINKKLLFAVSLLLAFGLMINLTSCDDDTDDPGNTDPLTLVAKKLTTGPTIDGSVDGLWGDVKKITVEAEVPDPGDDVFKGYVGDKHTVSMRAAYTDDNIYFLCEWNDADQSLSRQTWYFDPADDLWHQESRVPTYDGGGNLIRKPFYEDKFAFLWNVNGSVSGWDAQTCWTSCHTGLPEADGYARHFTNSVTQRIDMWHWKMVRTNVNGQADDQYQDDARPNGRHGDSKVSGGYSNNVQTLNNGVADVSVPKYFIPGMSNYYWITQAQIDAGTAKLITDVDAAGVLTYDGGTIDPVADTDFQRDGEDAGAKGMPSIYTTAFVGNRGDLTARGVYTGSGWILEWERALDSGDAEQQDVNFSAMEELDFGIGVFDNAGIAHAIKPGLKLIFEQ